MVKQMARQNDEIKSILRDKVRELKNELQRAEKALAAYEGEAKAAPKGKPGRKPKTNGVTENPFAGGANG